MSDYLKLVEESCIICYGNNRDLLLSDRGKEFAKYLCRIIGAGMSEEDMKELGSLYGRFCVRAALCTNTPIPLNAKEFMNAVKEGYRRNYV